VKANWKLFSDLVDSCALELLRPGIIMKVLDIIVESGPELTHLIYLTTSCIHMTVSLCLLLKFLISESFTQRNQVSYCIQSGYCRIIFQFVTCVFLLCIGVL
jgi:hypothetical protein